MKGESIKNSVADVIEEAEVCHYPINVFDILKNQGVKVKTYNTGKSEYNETCLMQSEDGFSVLKDNGECLQWYIFYNEDMPLARIAFTLMHELGHIARNHKGNSEKEERVANFFAKNILAPPIIIHEYSLIITDYNDLVEIFGISKEMAIYQMEYDNKWCLHGMAPQSISDRRILKQFRNTM